jgi:hypothetical protein
MRNPRIKLLDREGRREDIARLLAPPKKHISSETQCDLQWAD